MRYYIAATNQGSWGRGVHPWEALGNAILHAGRRSTMKGVLYGIEVPDGTPITKVYVNEMGGMVTPEEATVKLLLEDAELNVVVKKFDEFMTTLSLLLETDTEN
jgi:hypothetical protein